jgi:hypothetical protein
MAGKKQSLGTMEPRLGGVRVQTSLYGQAVTVAYGRARITGNLLQYVNFKATRQEEQSEAAKGGGSRPSRQYYLYSASVAMLLGEGPITAVRTVFKGKQRFSGETIAATVATAVHAATVPASGPYTVTAPGTWIGTVDVSVRSTDPTSWPPYNASLQQGVDYTVAAGVYTFDAAYANAPVEITYTKSVAGSSEDALGQLGLSLVPGAIGQVTWQYMATNFPAEAVPYAGFAYIRGQDYALTNAAEVENHSFEVDGFLGSLSDGDARPRDVIADMLTNTRYGGVGWPSSYLADWTTFVQYCDAYGLGISPACQEQRTTRDWIADILEATNTDPAWSGSALRLVPRGDEDAGSYVAPTTPVFALGPDDFLADDGEPPLRLMRASQAEVPNVVRAEFANRGVEGAWRDYALETVTAEDEASIIAHGRKIEATQTWHFFCDDAVRTALQLRLQRHQAVRNRWAATLPWRFDELELGDLVTLTDAGHQLAAWPARVVKITNTPADEFECVFEDYPIGHATAPVVPPQLGSGFRPDYNADPGNIIAPAFIEPPSGLTGDRLEVWAAISGQAGTPGQYWGGAEVYVSLDGGSSYKLVGRVDQGARFGTLTQTLLTGSAAIADVQLAGRGGKLQTVSAVEADTNLTLALVGGTATGEWLAFESAGLIGANAYRLSSLRRGLYGTADQQAVIGASFVYIDGAIAMSGPLPEEMIGRELKFKFCSFNVFGGGLQSLASVTEYSYTVTGRFRQVAVPTIWSGNKIPNASWLRGTAGWVQWFSGSSAGLSAGHVTMSPTQRIVGPPAMNVMIAEDGVNVPAVSVSTGWTHARSADCQAGERFGFACSLLPLSCDTGLSIAFYRADGSQIVGAEVFKVMASLPYASPALRESYLRMAIYATAPAGATMVRGVVQKLGTKAPAGSSYVWALEPDLREIIGPDAMPPFSDGPPGPQTIAYPQPYNDAGMVLSLSTLVFGDVAVGAVVAPARGIVKIDVVCEVAASASGGTSTITIGVQQTAKATLVARQVMSLASGVSDVKPVSLQASYPVAAGELIDPTIRLARTRFGLGVGNTTDAVRKISATYTLTMD